MEKDRFKKLFPYLSDEMENEVSSVKIEGGEPPAGNRRWAGYAPDVIDFIRRSDTPEQALEVIEYVEKRGEITPERAAELRRQLSREGPRSFGERKEPGFYHKDE